MLTTRIARVPLHSVVVACVVAFGSATAGAQDTTEPNTSVVSITGGADVVNQYVFRGIRQNSTKIALRPFAGIGLAVYSGDAALKRVTVHAGTWNSLHTGDTGSGGPAARLWYESDLYAGVGLMFGHGLSVAGTYTAYMSPNDMSDSVKELSLRLAFDDRAALGRAALQPYILGAVELDTAMARGQADGGLNAGTYIELGVTPGYGTGRVGFAFPAKVGLSVDDYYELGGQDHTFGFASTAVVVTVPLTTAEGFGRLSLHGGVEHQLLGETTRIFNGDDRSNTIGSIGIRFSY
jgi:hypothetical protein